MKIVIASDSYKGCMSSKTVMQQMRKAIHDVDEQIEVSAFLTGDGGEGTMDAFVESVHGRYIDICVHDTYGKRINTHYALIDNDTCAVIEVASIVGLNMYARDVRVPLYSSSYGIGEAIVHAYHQNVDRIILLLGGSGNADGGMGMLCALGMRFYDKDHHYLKGMTCNLEKIAYIDDRRLLDFFNIDCIAACDVNNDLLGEKGATLFYGKQKGLFPNQMRRVEKGMIHYSNLMKKQGYCIFGQAGCGAAGGVAGAFMGVTHAIKKSGLELLFQYNHIEEAIAQCDLVITGEGQSDAQTMYGKVPAGIVALANRYHKPCICISGALGLEYTKLYDLGFIGIYSIADRAMTFAQAIENAPQKLYDTTYSLIKTIRYFDVRRET